MANDQCKIEKPDPDGYLYKICNYIVKNKIKTNIKPNKYIIREIYKNETTIDVFLNCCRLGDIATIDNITKEVVGFSVGAK